MIYDKYDVDPRKRELIRDLNDIILRFMFYYCNGDWQYIHREATRYNFMWVMWIEPVYNNGYGNPPEAKYHQELIEPIWFREWQDRHP